MDLNIFIQKIFIDWDLPGVIIEVKLFKIVVNYKNSIEIDFKAQIQYIFSSEINGL